MANTVENMVYARDCRLLVCTDFIRENIKIIRQMTEKRLIAVIKENGYGAGFANLYRLLEQEGVDFFAVACSYEAFQLRALGWEGDLLLLAPEMDGQLCAQLLEQDVIFMLGSAEQAAVLRQTGEDLGRTPRIHLKIDCGLGRYGFYYERLAGLQTLLADFSPEGCYTHFSVQGRDFEKKIQTQLERFRFALGALREQGIDPGMTHAASSRVFCALGDLGLDAVRLGSLVLGKGDFYNRGFQDAVCLESQIYIIYEKKKGETVGYGNGVPLQRDSRIGLVRVGHTDGILLQYRDSKHPFQDLTRHLMKRDGLYVRLNQKRCAILGQSGVSHILIDLTDSGAEVGDSVVLGVNPLQINPVIDRVLVGKVDFPL